LLVALHLAVLVAVRAVHEPPSTRLHGRLHAPDYMRQITRVRLHASDYMRQITASDYMRQITCVR
jgi:hypothetical protein